MSTSSIKKAGCIVLNADDWGRDRQTTNQTMDCFKQGAISSVSAMVFMEDTERAANLAKEWNIDAGLHLNFTTPFTGARISRKLEEHQRRLARFLRRHRLAPVLFHPALIKSFEYVVAAQMDEFQFHYGIAPTRIDGHHHMHLCSNVLLSNLLPENTVVRRSFSFSRGEKGVLNRWYRAFVDRRLFRRHWITDYFFSLTPLEESRVRRILSCASGAVIELETHPANAMERAFLTSGIIHQWSNNLPIATRYVTAARRSAPNGAIDPTGEWNSPARRN